MFSVNGRLKSVKTTPASTVLADPFKLFPLLTFIVLLIFLQLLIFMVGTSLFTSSNRQQQSALPLIPFVNKACPSGRVYVYELPPMYNENLVRNCDQLNPWRSLCAEMMNHGFGRPADELAAILPVDLVPMWYWTDQYMLELIFHNRILNHKCRTSEPESATALYVPFYGALAVERHLWGGRSSAEVRDNDFKSLLSFLQDQSYWKKSNGKDHFMTIGRVTYDFRRAVDNPDGWGSSFFNMPAAQNLTRMLVEINHWDENEIGVPFPTGFHPSSKSDIRRWQTFVRTSTRRRLFSFVGGKRDKFRDDFRGILQSQCYNESTSCRAVDCSGSRCLKGGNPEILDAFLHSDFCLQPRGDSYARKSVFDCMMAGSIPVFFWSRTAYDQYIWFLPIRPDSYSVFIDPKEVKAGKSIKSVLETYSKAEVRRMREMVINFIPKFTYVNAEAGLDDVKDAFDIAVDRLLRRFKRLNNKQI